MSEDRQNSPPHGDTSGRTPLPLATVFKVLADHRRRTILYYLTRCTYPVPFEEIVEEVAMQESEATASEPSKELVEEVALDLYHTQLPKLAEADVIDYSKELQLIEVADTLRPLDEYLNLTKQHDKPQVRPRDQH